MKCMWGAAWVPGYSFGVSSGPAGFPAVFQKCLWRSTDTNTEKQSASPFVRPFFSFFFFVFFFFFPSPCFVKRLCKAFWNKHYLEKLSKENLVTLSKSDTECRAHLVLQSDLERNMLLLGHWCLAAHCGWRLCSQPETYRLSMGDQTTPQQMLNYTFIYDNSWWVLIISWT